METDPQSSDAKAMDTETPNQATEFHPKYPTSVPTKVTSVTRYVTIADYVTQVAKAARQVMYARDFTQTVIDPKSFEEYRDTMSHLQAILKQEAFDMRTFVEGRRKEKDEMTKTAIQSLRESVESGDSATLKTLKQLAMIHGLDRTAVLTGLAPDELKDAFRRCAFKDMQGMVLLPFSFCPILFCVGGTDDASSRLKFFGF